MSKSVYDLNEEARAKYKTFDNTYNDFPVGTRVKVICICQDHYFFKGNETGIVIKNNHNYLGIIIKFDKPRHFEGGYVQKEFNFSPKDLIREEEEKMEKILIVLERTDVEEISTVEELMLARNQLGVIDQSYQDMSLGTPEWVVDKLTAVGNEIDIRLRNELARRLKNAKARRSALRTADEKRKDLDAEIQELEKKLA
jgi:hypothetical protein